MPQALLVRLVPQDRADPQVSRASQVRLVGPEKRDRPERLTVLLARLVSQARQALPDPLDRLALPQVKPA